MVDADAQHVLPPGQSLMTQVANERRLPARVEGGSCHLELIRGKKVDLDQQKF